MMQMIAKHPQRWNELPAIPEPPPGAEVGGFSPQTALRIEQTTETETLGSKLASIRLIVRFS